MALVRWRRTAGISTPRSGKHSYSCIVLGLKLTLSLYRDRSSTGIVNLYEPSSMVRESGAERKALKAIGNLTTQVTTIKFNHDSQLVALASATNKDQLKLVHLPSATVFSNWPTQQTPLHHVTAVDFSRGSEWLAVGNKRGKVLLYSLKHYTR